MDCPQALNHRIRNTAWEATLLLLLPLAFYRGFAEPFSTPKSFLAKFAVISGLALLGLEEIWRILPRRHRSSFAIPLCTLSVALLGSCLASPVPRFSLMEVVYGLCGPGWLLLLVCWENGERAIHRISALVGLAGGLVAGVALLQRIGFDPVLLGGYRVDWGTMVPRMHMYSTFGNPNFVGGYLIGAIFAVVVLVATAKTWHARAVWTCVALMVLAAIILTGSHGAWLGLAVGSIAALITAATHYGWAFEPIQEKWGVTNARPVAAPLLWFPPAVITSSLAKRIAVQLHGRLYLCRFSWPAFWQHPIAGSGWGTYQLHYLNLQGQFLGAHPEFIGFWTNNRYLHNDALQVILETGLLGFGAFIWILWRYGQEAVRARQKSTNAFACYAVAASLGGVAAILTDSLFNYQFAVPPTYLLLFTLLAIPSLLVGEGLENGAGGIPNASHPHSHRLEVVGRIVGSIAVAAIASALLLQQARFLASERDYQSALDMENRLALPGAESAFRRSLELNALNGRARFGLSRVLLSRGRPFEALAQVIQSEQTFADSHQEVLRGQILERMGSNREAIQAYRRAISLDPTLTEIEKVASDLQRALGPTD